MWYQTVRIALTQISTGYKIKQALIVFARHPYLENSRNRLDLS
jgi:hypothetical protein